MKCTNLISEVDYYDNILEFYKQNEHLNVENSVQVQKWADLSYIQLMKDIRKKKDLKDAPIKDVVKNSIILILSLFDEKCQQSDESGSEELSEEEKRMLLKAIEN